jgi:hypothetical protein
MKAKYALEGASQIVVDVEAIESLGVCPVMGDYLLEEGGVVRHNYERVAHDLMQIAVQSPGANHARPVPSRA